MQDFKKLEIWKDAIEFCTKVYKVTKDFPKEERYGLTSQLRRASSSISINIAEGCGRRTNADFKQFLHIAMGSVKECETLLILSNRLGYLLEKEFNELGDELTVEAKKLNNFIKSLK